MYPKTPHTFFPTGQQFKRDLQVKTGYFDFFLFQVWKEVFALDKLKRRLFLAAENSPSASPHKPEQRKVRYSISALLKSMVC